MDNIPVNESFDIAKNVNRWAENLKAQPDITESDRVELKSHLMESIEELRDAGLSDEESFLIATRRMGSSKDLEDEYRQVNYSVIQLRKSTIILAGVLFYFLFYYFSGVSFKLLFMALYALTANGGIAVAWVTRYLIAINFLFILFVASVYLREQKVINFIDHVRLRPKHSLLLFILIFILNMTNLSLLPVIKNMTHKDLTLLSKIFELSRNFEIIFPILITAGFVLLYKKYYKLSKYDY